MILYIYGDDTLRSRQFLKKSIDEFKSKRDPQGLNTLIFDVVKEAPDRIFGEIVASPFLAEKRMIVLQNVLANSDKEFLERIITMMADKKIPESNVVIFWQAEPIGKTSEAKKLAGILAKEKYAYEFPQMSPAELAGWVVKEVTNRGGKIDRMTAGFLAQNIDADMWLLHSLIDQLIAYKKGEEIRTADARLFLDEKVDDNIFNMVDTIVAGNKKQAFKLLKEQRRIGQDDGYLFSMILRQFKILLQMRDLWEQADNLTSDAMAKTLGLHPFVAKKSLPLVKRYNLEQLKRVYDELLQVDIKTKTGLADQPLLIDLFVGKI
ncbi:MAG: DNA polymerase III subunit delta [Patescibacteria group bacterium]|nr:DNA polymerase III subunit delta [Patescibacteria group bacterium]